MAKGKKKKTSPDTICQNKRARREYDIENTFEAGLMLAGTEVKSIRAGHANLVDAYANIKEGEVYLYNLDIAPYENAAHFNHEPRRRRKLLMHRQEIFKLTTKIKERGYTLIPLDLHYKNGFVKVTLALAKGKKQYDNRQEILAKQERREMRSHSHRH
ncbi:MAG: SsrA-binding protein SmpB [Deltaproteobacteria bacterium]|nr:SsrA-binding protein SmpB [Deltaproteobacteria bacterium]